MYYYGNFRFFTFSKKNLNFFFVHNQIYNYVTDDDVTSKNILKYGNLQRRVTIIPMNKITSRCLNSSVIKIAENLVCVSTNFNDGILITKFLPGWKRQCRCCTKFD